MNGIYRASSKITAYVNPLRDYFHRAIRLSDGCSNWYDLSYDNEDETCDGNDVPFKKGYKYEDLLQTFKNDIPYKNIHLETKVSKIDFTDTDTVKVFDQDGRVFIFGHSNFYRITRNYKRFQFLNTFIISNPATQF